MFTDKPMIIYFVSKDKEVVYIGQTKSTLPDRRKQHERLARQGKGYVIGSGIRKHGANQFEWNVHSVYYNQVDLDAAEKHYIAKYKPRYNINLGGEARGIRKNKGSTPWNKGKKATQTAWNKGRKETRPEVIVKIKAGAVNRDNTNRKISESQRAAMVKGRREKYMKTQSPFICHQNNKTYVLVVDAARDLEIDPSGIYSVLNPDHKMKSYKGFTFSYI